MNPIQATNAGGGDVFVTKINAGGNGLVYSTYLGGSGNDSTDVGGMVTGIGVDPVGNVYITGGTRSNDFPVINAIQSTFGGAFIAGINAGGDALIYSTYFGGVEEVWGAGVAVDSQGSAYVAGRTWSRLSITPAAAYRSYADSGAFLHNCTKHFRQWVTGKNVPWNTLGGNKSAPKNVTLKNNGTAPLTIGRIYFVGANKSDFNQTNTCGDAIAAGAKCTIAVSFSPSALNLRQAVLVISDSDPASPPAVALGAYGTVVSFSPTKLSFGNQSVGTVASQSVTLTNISNPALNIRSISVTGADAGDFSQINNCGTGIPADNVRSL